MPLPDERPRQSVANLIGRFEKQKSSSGAAALPPAFPRTSSVSSHRTEDSAQEEIKERREWPPKSVQTSATLTLPEPVLGKPLPPSASTLPVEKDLETPPEVVLQSPPAEAQPPSLPVISTEAMPPKARSPPPSGTKPVSTRLASSVKSPAPKPTVKPSTATPLKSTASGGSTSSTPLKPQDTGQSTMSTGSAAKTAAKRVSAAPKPPVATTPSRVKTPLSTTRAKTPSSEIRPKTPSSGLYAPTAASLARSRTGAPAPTPVEKPKRKITTDLSKPTAASASRMRTPAATPARSGKPPVGKQTATKLAVKPAVSKPIISTRQSGAANAARGKPAAGYTKVSGANMVASSVGPAIHTDIAASNIENSSEMAVHNLTEQKLVDVPNAAAGGSIEIMTEDPTHELNIYEDGSPEEYFGEQESHVEAEIENYDGHFSDENHDLHDDHGGGDVEGVETSSGVLDESPAVEEADQQHDVEPENTTHDHHPHDSEDAYAHPKDIEEQHPLSLPTSRGIPVDMHEPDENGLHERVSESTEAKANSTSMGTDLEDIVNLLESGANIHRPSIATSSAASTVETGEIPDEY